MKVVQYLVKEVNQFPSDIECMRYIATIADKVFLFPLSFISLLHVGTVRTNEYRRAITLLLSCYSRSC